MSEQLSTDRPAPRRRGRAVALLLGVALAGGLVGAFATKSFSQGFGPPWHMTVMGPGMGPFGGPPTPEQIVDARRPRGAPSRDRARRHRRAAGPSCAPIVKGAVNDLRADAREGAGGAPARPASS